MNMLIEKKFANNFICHRLRDRLIFELSSPKHRRKAISRFSSNIENIVIPSKIMLKTNTIDISIIDKIIKENSDNINEVYVISTNTHNGTFIPNNKALQNCIDEYMPIILIINNDFVFIKTEVEIGAPIVYFLKL